MVKGARRDTGGRGSAEAIEKRRVARQLNTLFGATGSQSGKLDGRTEKRRQRLLKELKEGKRGQALKPIEIITHASELLDMGETLATIRKNGLKANRIELDGQDEKADAVRRAQEAYQFHPEVWKLLGIDLEELGDGSESLASKKKKRS